MNYKIKLGKEKTIQALVKAGEYDWFNDDIEKFPFENTEAKEIELVHFGHDISSEDAVTGMDKQGLRPATATELLLLGAQHPELQRTHYIAALGTVRQVCGHRGVAYLGGCSALRSLYVVYWSYVWSGFWVFAAVRKSPLDAGKLGSEELGNLDGETFELTIAGKVYEGTLKLKG